MARSRHYQAEQEESYFVSMTDMMIGVLFVFIIMLMAFALNLREAEEVQEQEIDRLTGAMQARTELLRSVEKSLKELGVEVKIFEDQGILRLPEQILFAHGDKKLKPAGRDKVRKLATALNDTLPCYIPHEHNSAPSVTCTNTEHFLDSVLIEGHTDTSKYRKGAEYDNWNLSSDRAINTYRELVNAEPELSQLKNSLEQKILSVSGYAFSRLVDGRSTPEAQEKNRRIDLRFIMATPHMPEPAKKTREKYQVE